jgi:regulator of protease activity HflC (stomatin/prohibitin superfamily)
MGLCFLSNDRKAILKVEKFNFAITQLAQAALRDVCGKVELDTILSKEEMGKTLKPLLRKKQKFGV